MATKSKLAKQSRNPSKAQVTSASPYHVQVQAFKTATKHFDKVANSSPSLARQTLQAEGILTATGRISKNYRG